MTTPSSARAEYMHIGGTQIRLRISRPRRVIGVNRAWVMGASGFLRRVICLRAAEGPAEARAPIPTSGRQKYSWGHEPITV
ncbi:hypothetical protein GCM10009793_01930 [Brachybacterium phenoliresistens]